jgi:hypothetical protein
MTHNACDIAADPNTSPEELASLAKHANWLVVAEVAWNKSATSDTLRMIYRPGTHVQIRRAVAYNRNTPNDILAKMAEDTDGTVRLFVSMNTSTPEAVRLWLKGDGYAGMSLAEFMDNTNANDCARSS